MQCSDQSTAGKLSGGRPEENLSGGRPELKLSGGSSGVIPKLWGRVAEGALLGGRYGRRSGGARTNGRCIKITLRLCSAVLCPTEVELPSSGCLGWRWLLAELWPLKKCGGAEDASGGSSAEPWPAVKLGGAELWLAVAPSGVVAGGALPAEVASGRSSGQRFAGGGWPAERSLAGGCGWPNGALVKLWPAVVETRILADSELSGAMLSGWRRRAQRWRAVMPSGALPAKRLSGEVIRRRISAELWPAETWSQRSG